MASSSDQYLLPTLSFNPSIERSRSADSGNSPRDSERQLLSARQQEKRPVAAARPFPSGFSSRIEEPLSRLERLGFSSRAVERSPDRDDGDVEAQFSPPARARTLEARYPIRELDGCCRTILMLHFEFAVYDEANEAGKKNLPFKRMADLEHATGSLRQILSGIEDEERRQMAVAWSLRLTKYVLAIGLPMLRRGQDIQKERKVYVVQLLKDLPYVKKKLQDRDRPYRMLAKALHETLSDESNRLLSFDASSIRPLHIDKDISKRLDLDSSHLYANVQPKENALLYVRQHWQRLMIMNHHDPAANLQEIWATIVVGDYDDYAPHEAGNATKPASSLSETQAQPADSPVHDYIEHGPPESRNSPRVSMSDIRPDREPFKVFDVGGLLDPPLPIDSNVPARSNMQMMGLPALDPLRNTPFYDYARQARAGSAELGETSWPILPRAKPDYRLFGIRPPPKRNPDYADSSWRSVGRKNYQNFRQNLDSRLPARTPVVQPESVWYWSLQMPFKNWFDRLKKVPEPAAVETPDIFVVVGWFPGALHEPREICIQVQDAQNFLSEVQKKIKTIRGWRRFLSFKTVQGFGLYKCHPKEGGHSIYEASQAEIVALSQFYHAVNRPFLHSSARYTAQDSKDWAEWVYHNFNNSQKYPFRAELSLQLVIKWSQVRLIIAATIPLLLSMGVGMYYMAVHEGVEGASAAWTIASYIVTAGAFIIALLAVLSSLKDG